MQRIGLADAIRALRAELGESMRAGAGEDLRFQVGEVELEFHVEVERSAGAKGGIRFWVVEIGGEGSQASTKTHVVKMPLKPVTLNPQTKNLEPVVTGLQSNVIPE